MSEKENVRNLLTGVNHPINWRYTIHLIANIRDEELKMSLAKQIKHHLTSLDNNGFLPYIDRLSMKNYDGPTICRDLKEEMLIERKAIKKEKIDKLFGMRQTDFSNTAAAQECQFLFWNAIQSYKRDYRITRRDHHYVKRAYLHICLDEWEKAYYLSKKSNDIELEIVLSFSFGDFEKVIDKIEPALLMIQQGKINMASKFELLHIITLSMLCSYKFISEEDPVLSNFYDVLIAEYLFPIKKALSDFCKGNYISTFDWINSLEDLSALSIYLCVAFPLVQAAAIENAIYHFCYPYKIISTEKIVERFPNVEPGELEMTINRMCAENKLPFKNDYVDGALKRVPKLEEKRAHQLVLRRSKMSIAKFQELLWYINNTEQK